MRIDKNYKTKVRVIEELIKKGGAINNLEQIKELFSYANRSSAKLFLNKLVRDGFLEFTNKKYLPTNLLTGYPLFESVRAGLPFTPYNDDTATQLEINKYLVEHPNSTFLVKVKGDSMKDAGIMEGDIVVVDKSLNPKNGDIIIASFGGAVTIKYYKKEDGKIYLIPANEKYQTKLINEDAEILGVVSGTIRKYN